MSKIHDQNIIHTLKKSDKDTLGIFLLFIPIIVFFTILAVFKILN